MPKLSVWLVRASLIHLGIGFTVGALLLWHKGMPIFDWAWQLLNPHLELLVFGWTMQFVMGIAFWILPRFSTEPRYGKAIFGWWSFGLLNSGVLLTAIGLWAALLPIAIIGRLCTLSAVILFARLIWARIKPLGGLAASQQSST
ncbi:MAG: hypothetical protein KF726_03190 [Anaerolineae bacterium]|nr:hypothetical protein [Anaerolineae bacterium]